MFLTSLVYSAEAFTGVNGPNCAESAPRILSVAVARVASVTARPAERLTLSVTVASLVNAPQSVYGLRRDERDVPRLAGCDVFAQAGGGVEGEHDGAASGFFGLPLEVLGDGFDTVGSEDAERYGTSPASKEENTQ